MARLSTSSSSGGTVVQLPETLLAAARRVAGDSLTLDEYTLARVIASEGGREPRAHQLAIGDADITRAAAAGRSIYQHATGGSGRYGRQGYPPGGPKRPVSTTQDPTTDHLAVARELLGGRAGWTGGATAYFNPAVQYSCWAHPTSCVPADVAGAKNRNQHPLDVLEKWAYARSATNCGRDTSDRYRCTLGPKSSTGGMTWVGPLNGVDAYRLMLFRPTRSADHEQRTAQARLVITSGIAGRSAPAVVAEQIGIGGLIATFAAILLAKKGS